MSFLDWLVTETGTYVFCAFILTAYILFVTGLLLGDWLANRITGEGGGDDYEPPEIIPPDWDEGFIRELEGISL